MRFPLHSVVLRKLSTFPTATALQRKIVYAAGRCPPMYRLVDRYRPFHFSLRFSFEDWH